MKAILFKGTLKGRGIVNYDGKDKKWMLKLHKRNEGGSALDFDNFKVGKHTFTEIGRDENNKPHYDVKLKISSNCLRNAIFSMDFPFQNNTIMHSKKLLNRSIASVAGLLRGYMFEAAGFTGLKRKSPVIIVDAEQTCSSLSTIDLHSTSGSKKKNDDDDTAGTSLFYKETVGAVEYGFSGAINLTELQFISLSEVFDRMAVNPDEFENLYRPYLEKSVGGKVANPGFYLMKNAVNPLPEEGVLLTQPQTILLVKEFFKRLLALNITRSASAYASLSGLQVKYVRNPITDKMDSNDGWIHVKDISDIEIDRIATAYESISDSAAKDMLEDIEGGMLQARQIRKALAAQKENSKKGRKNVRKSADN